MNVNTHAALDSRERVNRMFERRDHDRVPRHDSFWSDTVERWQREGLFGDARSVLDALESDFQPLSWIWPQAFPGEERLVSQDAETRVVRDANGKVVRYWKGRMGTPEHLGFDCDSRDKWERVFKPALLETGLQCDPSAIARSYRQARHNGKWCHLAGVESFEETRSLMGDEITLMAMAEDPEWIRDVSRTFTELVLRNLDAAMATGIQPDGLWIYGDMAFKTATMCSPAMFDEFVLPYQKPLLEKFALNYYGCCEQLEQRFEKVERGVPRLRRVSVAPHAHQRKLAEQIAGRYVFCRKCDPVPVCVGFNEEAIRADIRHTLDAARGQAFELIMKDTHTVEREPWRLARWVEIAREEIARAGLS